MMACQNARLSTEERAMLDLVKENLDKHLQDHWEGGPFMMKTAACSARVIFATVRAYEQHGWDVMAQPIDSPLGIKAAEVLSIGGNPNWAITLKPRWHEPRNGEHR